MSRHVERERAKIAWQCVVEKAKGESWAGKYRSLARGLPAMLQSSGLLQTLAFLRTKKAEHKAMADHLCRGIKEAGVIDAAGAVKQIATDFDSAKYRRATVVALAFAHWLKRFAEAELPEEEKKSEEKAHAG